jgi:heat shock protein HslJ
VPDIRIHDIWAVIALGTTKLHAADFPKGIPVLEININENRVSGHDGCNNFVGRAVVKGENITFGNLASTRMACPNMQTSAQIPQVLSGKGYVFAIKNNQLLLSTGDQVVMTLQHRD